MRTVFNDTVYGVVVVVLFLLSSCGIALSGSGGLERRMAVEQLFDRGVMLSGYNYYSEGPPAEPEAIIAIANEFQLKSKLWIKREWTEEELAESVRWMRLNEYGLCRTDGGVLLAPDGRKVGIWFSKKDSSIIRQPALGVVEVYPFTYVGTTPCSSQNRRDDF